MNCFEKNRRSLRRVALIAAIAVAGTLATIAALPKTAQAEPATQPSNQKEAPAVSKVLSFKMKSLDGQDVDLSKYEGKVVLIVNTASKCGNTPQYAQLEKMYEKYKDKGLVILGFPANNFGGQEPGTDTEISTFCTKNYGVTFDMFSKISVKGDDKAPLYKLLTEKDSDPKFAGEISWNFEKFLLNRKGEPVARFHPKVKPDAPEVVKAIEAELAAQ